MINDNDVNDGGIVIADDDDSNCYPHPAAMLPSLWYLDWSAAAVAANHRLAHPPHCNPNRNRHHNSPGGGRRGGGRACCAAPPCSSCERHHVPIPIRCSVVALVFQQGGGICAVSIVRLHPEGGNGRERRVPPRPGGGGVIPCAICLR
jgi:hypothetical protein